MANKTRWTQNELDQLKYMKEKGTKLSVISKMLNRTEKAVGLRLTQLGYSASDKHVSVRPHHRTKKVEKQLELLPVPVVATKKPKIQVTPVWILASRSNKPSWFARTLSKLMGTEWRQSLHKTYIEE